MHAGMVLLQLAVPKLRQMQSLRDFTKLLKREDCDIYAALKAARLPAKHTALLDADKGAGWDLLAGLLRPRSVQVDNITIVIVIVITSVCLILTKAHHP